MNPRMAQYPKNLNIKIDPERMNWLRTLRQAKHAKYKGYSAIVREAIDLLREQGVEPSRIAASE